MKAGRILFVEPFSGVSGDMLLGALLDLGIDRVRWEEKLRLLPLSGYRLSWTDCSRAGIQALKFDVIGEEEDHRPGDHHHDHHGHRTFGEVRRLIEGSGLSDWVKQKSIEAFGRLAEAEGKIHNQPTEAVHFHEVGAVDSIIDMVGAVAAIEELMPVRIVSARVNVGQGSLQCRHGSYPAPGPATLELLKRVPIYAASESGELTTPTGAALLVTLCESFGPRPLMKVDRIGYGAGSRDIPGHANVLRLTLGQEGMPDVDMLAAGEEVTVIEANVDDMNPQLYGYFQEKALAAGALDVFAASILMKKNRPGLLISVVCESSQADALASLIFAETTTIGLRYARAQRKTLEREFLQVQTRFGQVTIKVSSSGGSRLNFAPEYECCRRLAQETGAALKDIISAATQAYLEQKQ